MNRLTCIIDNEIHLNCNSMCADYCDTLKKVDDCKGYSAYKKLAKYEELEEKGLIVRNQWITCSERLPDKASSYLVTKMCVDTEEEKKLYEVCSEIFWTKDNKWDSERDEYCDWKVIAWQPLPQPYKERERNEQSQ